MKKNKNAIDIESLGVRTKRLRIAHGFTQRQLGALVGTSGAAVGKWESGECLPKGRYLAKLAGALGIDVVALLGETPIGIDEVAEEVRLVAAFRELPEERQLIAIKLIEALR